MDEDTKKFLISFGTFVVVAGIVAIIVVFSVKASPSKPSQNENQTYTTHGGR